MTRAEFERINQNRIGRGQRPLTFTETPGRNQTPLVRTAASIIGAPSVKELRRGKIASKPRSPSHLEEKFTRLWNEAGGPELVPEFRFCKERRWRADFCHERSRTLIEIEGGAFCGRHTKAKGFIADAEKYLAAWLQGWTVVRLTAPQLTSQTITAVALRLVIR